MIEEPISTPVLLILFNRPSHVQRLLDRLRQVRPTLLFVAVDGPRMSHPTDVEQVARSISLINSIDWPCTIHRLIREQNLGCKKGVSSSINWFFSKVEEGIILEDDCLPDPAFFSFCTDLLTRYRQNEQVMHINGTNLAAGHWWSSDSYLFTKVCHVWGWASWRRAWQHYDINMTDYPTQRIKLINQLVHNENSRFYWRKAFDETYAGKIDTWDYQWVFSIWLADGLCILPAVNMISNIGFNHDATHTKFVTKFAELPTTSLVAHYHPDTVVDNVQATESLFQTLYILPNVFTTLINRVKQKITWLNKRQ